jgi:imidazole glycerol-phosphate synthase subunit HisH
MRVVVADLGLGNLRSVERAIVRAAADHGAHVSVEVSGDPAILARADLLVFPGQGAFRDGAAVLGEAAGEVLRAHIEAGRPYFGICLGMQLLFEESDEAPGARGLGVLAGAVRRLGGPELAAVGERKVPHMGWNEIRARFDGTPIDVVRDAYVYFVHSFAAMPADRAVVAAEAEYGVSVVAAVARDNVFAVQFHPEKSQAAGRALLRAVMAWAEGRMTR